MLLRGGGDILARTRFNFNIDNGILTAYEAMNLNLENTDLVVLRVLVKPARVKFPMVKGVMDYHRTFFVAGAKVLIKQVSFKVDDDATPKLDTQFLPQVVNWHLSLLKPRKSCAPNTPTRSVGGVHDDWSGTRYASIRDKIL